jgi:hypothetical protein
VRELQTGRGQTVMLGAVEYPAKERPYSGGWGCEACAEGLPGEVRDPDRVHVVRIVAAPSREELRDLWAEIRYP